MNHGWIILLLWIVSVSHAEIFLQYDLSGNLVTQSNSLAVTLPVFQQLGQTYQGADSNGLLSISVPVTGPGQVTYQWLLNGVSISGATNDSFFLANTASNNLGNYQLVASNSGGSVTSAVLNVSFFDPNGTGLPVAWEMQYFGHTGVDPDADPDGDCESNYQEYLDGTNPTNANSVVVRLHVVPSSGGTVTVTPLKPTYQTNDTIQVTATPYSHYLYEGLSIANCSSANVTNPANPATVAMTGSRTIEPIFLSGNIWTNPAGGKWETGGNWALGVPPSLGEYFVFITNANTKTVTIDAATRSNAPNSMTIWNLKVSAPAGSTNTLSISNVGVGNFFRVLDRIPNDFIIGSGGVVSVTNSTVLLDYGSNSVIDALDALSVGAGSQNMRLLIEGGGQLSDVNGGLGYYPTGSNNTALVTGSGSAWRSSGLFVVGIGGPHCSLTVSNGSAVSCGQGILGYSGSSASNTVLVSDAGSVWSNSTTLVVGLSGGGNQLTISNGGAVYDSSGYLGFNSSSSGNKALVTGNGSVWSNASGLFVGNSSGSTGNVLQASGGSVQASSLLVGGAGQGALLVSGGAVSAGSLVATNSGSHTNTVTLNSGVLASGGTVVSNGLLFLAGNGTNAATFQINGGTHSFANSLEVRSNATLAGCGTVIGSVLVDAGGTVLADCGGTLTFTGSVTNNGTMRAINGSVLEAYGAVVNNGTIDLINGSTNFHGTFINNGTVLGPGSVKISQASLSGQDFVVQILSAAGHTYQLQYTPSLAPPAWANSGASQGGNGGTLTFTDPGATTNAAVRFYRVQVSGS